ncbi:beta-galactosidase [Kineosporia babensis]|uniref:beta-galactosidase n=1 Tax=Kineosporia babensis TaxID=499548 RepID=A0A9X1NGS1_9ACTN|nr:beta-galactosidase [Kineosporia babensis]MCD5314752.1 beta-galactosidase [Kineosporia babensis]
MTVLYGAAYYAEYHRPEQAGQLDRDLDLMQQAGFTVIRVGESVWSTWEPRDGEFDLDWLLPVLDGAHQRGIKVILGTPTYAVPPWLQQAYPEIAADKPDGRPVAWGGRQEVDYSHPAFRFHAERVIRAVIARYAEHPAVIGYQVDNEPGLLLFHNHGAFTRFVRRLKQQYGDVETLNREWGLTYWSHRIADWSELWRPEGNTLPQYDLAWRRYQADLTTEFIAWQADLVRSYARPGQFVTTCISYPRPAADDHALANTLDVTAGNPYYAMQDHLDATQDLPTLSGWTTSGIAGLFRQADRLYSSRQERFLVTETNAQSIDGSWNNRPPWPGQLRQAAFALISRGASMIEYWHWHTLPYGTETYWGGVIPHSLQPGRIYREVAEIGNQLKDLDLDGFEPDTDVALLWSNPSNWALQFFPPLATSDGKPDPASYERIFDAYHRGVIDAGAQARILHLTQATELGAQALAEKHPVLIAPALYVADDAELELLRDYAAAGGHLVLGIRTGYGDEEARARIAVAPAILGEPAGVHYDEYSNLSAPIEVSGDLTGAATGWIDGLIVDDAETVARYTHPRFGEFPAVTTTSHGAGRITTVGTVPDNQLATAIVHWLVPDKTADELLPERSLPVTVSSGTLKDGRRAWFLFNWSWDEISVKRATGESITLPSWGTHLLLE